MKINEAQVGMKVRSVTNPHAKGTYTITKIWKATVSVTTDDNTFVTETGKVLEWDPIVYRHVHPRHLEPA